MLCVVPCDISDLLCVIFIKTVQFREFEAAKKKVVVKKVIMHAVAKMYK